MSLQETGGVHFLNTVAGLVTFDRVVVAVIALNSVLLVAGLLDRPHAELLERAETACLWFFVGQLVVRLRRCGWRPRVFARGWNIADTVVIVVSLLPAVRLGRLL